MLSLVGKVVILVSVSDVKVLLSRWAVTKISLVSQDRRALFAGVVGRTFVFLILSFIVLQNIIY